MSIPRIASLKNLTEKSLCIKLKTVPELRRRFPCPEYTGSQAEGHKRLYRWNGDLRHIGWYQPETFFGIEIEVGEAGPMAIEPESQFRSGPPDLPPGCRSLPGDRESFREIPHPVIFLHAGIGRQRIIS
jgi:hypothetical protein